jgi:hypothetical protein
VSNPVPYSKSPINWLWIGLLVVLFIVTIGWFFNPLGSAGVTPQVQSTAHAADSAPLPAETTTVTLPANRNPPKPK